MVCIWLGFTCCGFGFGFDLLGVAKTWLLVVFDWRIVFCCCFVADCVFRFAVVFCVCAGSGVLIC